MSESSMKTFRVGTKDTPKEERLVLEYDVKNSAQEQIEAWTDEVVHYLAAGYAVKQAQDKAREMFTEGKSEEEIKEMLSSFIPQVKQKKGGGGFKTTPSSMLSKFEKMSEEEQAEFIAALKAKRAQG